MEVASAVEITHPQQAIEIFAQLAQSQIAQRNRQNYATAATYLQRVKRIYQRIGDNPGWQQSIQLIRTKQKCLPAIHF